MEGEVVASPEPLVDTLPEVSPAPAAEDQKATDGPASEADAQNPEAVTETPEQQEAKRESRRASQRARARERHAAELATAQAEARIYREQLEALKQAKPQESGAPKRENYPDIPYEEFLDIRQDWRMDQKLKSEREANQGKEQQGKASAAEDAMAKSWAERETALKSQSPGYQKAVNDFLDEGTLSPGAIRAIIESEVGPQVLHYLAANAEAAERIADLSPLRQIAEVGKLEDKLPSAKPAKAASNAPAPIKPVGQGRSASLGISESDSQAEYESKRKAQGARWAR